MSKWIIINRRKRRGRRQTSRYVSVALSYRCTIKFQELCSQGCEVRECSLTRILEYPENDRVCFQTIYYQNSRIIFSKWRYYRFCFPEST